MAYLAKEDYTIDISIEDLDKILTESEKAAQKSQDTIRQEAELLAQARIMSFVSARYDIASEFAKNAPDTSRARMIMKCMVSISLYFIHFTINPRNIPALRKKAYEDCIDDLKMIQEGNLTLIGVSEVEDPVTFAEIRSQKKFISKPFTDSLITDTE